MKSFSALLTSVIISLWMGAIAVISVQNFTPVSLKFLQFQSFQLPLGLVLALSSSLGVLGAAVIQPLLNLSSRNSDNDF